MRAARERVRTRSGGRPRRTPAAVRSRLFADQVPEVGVVLLAYVFERLHAGMEQDIPAGGPRLGVRAGILDGGLVMEDQLVDAGKALDDVQLFGVGMAGRIDPAAVV